VADVLPKKFKVAVGGKMTPSACVLLDISDCSSSKCFFKESLKDKTEYLDPEVVLMNALERNSLD
jgi:hypothetical protein